MSSDPYVYPGTTILKNIPRIRNQKTLDRFEADRVGQRSLELIENPLSGLFDVVHLQRIHRYLFQDVYEWAGHFRTVDIAKGKSFFAHVPYIRSTLEGLFARLSEEQHPRGVSQEAFAHRAAEILGTLNAVHPFREGNGRTHLLTYEEIGTTSNPSYSARRVNAISGTRVLIHATVRIPDCAFSTSSKPERRLFASSVSSCERSE